MALIKCYECGKDISDKAPICPNCGAPQKIESKGEILDQLKNIRDKFSGIKLIFSNKNSKYSIPLLFIFLGTIVPVGLIGVTGLKESNWDLNNYSWRLQNRKFIESRCKNYSNNKVGSIIEKRCKSMIYKIGSKAKQIPFSNYSYCNRSLVKNARTYGGITYGDYSGCLRMRERALNYYKDKRQRERWRLQMEAKKRQREAEERKRRPSFEEQNRINQEKKGNSLLENIMILEGLRNLNRPTQQPKTRTKCRTTYNSFSRSYETTCQ